LGPAQNSDSLPPALVWRKREESEGGRSPSIAQKEKGKDFVKKGKRRDATSKR